MVPELTVPEPPPPPVMQVLLTEKHPVARLIPLVNVDVAEPVWLMAKTFKPPEKVEVAFALSAL